MKNSYDAIIIGAGHNGLVAAAYLAKSGLSVLVLESREIIGGLATTENLFSSYRFNTGPAGAGMFSQKIIKELNLEQHGLRFLENKASVFAPQLEGSSLTLWHDEEQAINELSRVAAADVAAYPRYLAEQRGLVKALSMALALPAPDISDLSAGNLLPWMKMAMRLRLSKNPGLMETLRVLPLAARDYLDGWFGDKKLKGVLALPAITGGMPGPFAAGTTLMMIYQQLGGLNGGYRTARFVKGGLGKLAEALAAAATTRGVEILTGTRVDSIILDDERARGVVLATGEAVAAQAIISNADPRRTFFDLVGGPHLAPEFVRDVANIRFGGMTASVNLALSSLPSFKGASDQEQLTGYIAIAPDMEYLERAYDDAKYGQISKNLVLEATIPSLLDPGMAPPESHVMSITVLYTPYHLKEGNWDDQRERLGDQVVDTLALYAPDLPQLIVQRHVTTPLDWERDFGLSEGQIFHGKMGLDQMLHMRPLPGYANHRTPFRGLYLCGAGTHPGGGVNGLPGYNAARAAIKDSN